MSGVVGFPYVRTCKAAGRRFYQRELPEAVRAATGKRFFKRWLRSAGGRAFEREYLDVAAEHDALVRDALTPEVDVDEHRARQFGTDWAILGWFNKHGFDGWRPAGPADCADGIAKMLGTNVAKTRTADGVTERPEPFRLAPASMKVACAAAFEAVEYWRLAEDDVSIGFMLDAERAGIYSRQGIKTKVETERQRARLSIVAAAHREHLCERGKPEGTIVEWELAVRRFVCLFGDMDVREITIKQARQYRNQLRRIPAVRGSELNSWSVAQQIAWADERGAPRIAPGTINKMLSGLRGALDHACHELGWFDEPEHQGWRNPLEGFSETDPVPEDEKRRSLTREEKIAFFRRVAEQPREGPDAHMFWLPVLADLTGCRIEELGQLAADDFVYEDEDGTHLFHVRRDRRRGQSAKTKASVRAVPIPRPAIDLGLLDLVEARRAVGAEFVFDLVPRAGTAKRTAKASKDLNKLLDRAVPDPATAFHSLRHGFRNACERGGLTEDETGKLMGHANGKITGLYGERQIVALKRLMDRVRYDVDLVALLGAGDRGLSDAGVRDAPEPLTGEPPSARATTPKRNILRTGGRASRPAAVSSRQGRRGPAALAKAPAKTGIVATGKACKNRRRSGTAPADPAPAQP